MVERPFGVVPGVESAPIGHPVRHSIAIDDRGRGEPATIDPPDNRDPIELKIVLISIEILAKPAFTQPRLPVKISLLAARICRSIALSVVHRASI